MAYPHQEDNQPSHEANTECKHLICSNWNCTVPEWSKDANQTEASTGALAAQGAVLNDKIKTAWRCSQNSSETEKLGLFVSYVRKG